MAFAACPSADAPLLSLLAKLLATLPPARALLGDAAHQSAGRPVLLRAGDIYTITGPAGVRTGSRGPIFRWFFLSRTAPRLPGRGMPAGGAGLLEKNQ